MLFKTIHLEGIRQGKISLAFRKWKKPSVKKGSLIKTAIGQVEIIDVEPFSLNRVTESEAKKAGFSTRAGLVNLLNSVDEGKVYRIKLRYHSPDPRLALRESDDLDQDEYETLRLKLERLDKSSASGPWTRKTLTTIKANPQRRAADLATMLNQEKDALKLNIRKLKNLGLTISHEVGYTLSPRGIALLKSLR